MKSAFSVGAGSLFLVGALLSGCSGSPSAPPAETPTVALTGRIVTLDTAGESRLLSTVVTGTGQVPSWTSRDNSVVTVAANGLVTARRPGTATVVVSLGTSSDSAQVTVRPWTNVEILSASTRATGGAAGQQEIVTIRVRNLNGSGLFWLEFSTDSTPTQGVIRVSTLPAAASAGAEATGDFVMYTAEGGRPRVAHVQAHSRGVGEGPWRAGPVYHLPAP